jgi:hypothetical protein
VLKKGFDRASIVRDGRFRLSDLGVLRIEYLAAYQLLNGLYENASPY